MTPEEQYQLWCRRAADDADLTAELSAIKGNESAIRERFSAELVFGTAGLRGIIGAGTSLMNIYTVRRTTQGLADYILSKRAAEPSVAIAYDSRNKSELFSKEAAAVLAANGIRAYLYPELMPTPMLSYAVRTLGAQAGINVTASHNPAQYNGYKVYGADGCQMTDQAAAEVYQYIQKVDMFDGVSTVPFGKGLAEKRIVYIDQSVPERYLDEVQKQSITPGICQKANLKVIYTPLNGAGNKPVRTILKRIGVENVTVVPEQEAPDGNFPTCPYPNPEIRQAFECGLKLAQKNEPDLLLATDPDCDRVGIAVRDGDDYRLFTGNEVGAIMLRYILSQRAANGTLPQNPLMVKTIVTTPLVYPIAAKYGCEVVDVLTGFKYIGEQILLLEEKGCPERFVLGFEESYGYLSGAYVRDKDAVFASMMICEMAAFYKLQGKSLIAVLNDINREFGCFVNIVHNFEFKGLAGMSRMKAIMDQVRAEHPATLCGKQIIRFSDYLLSEEHNLLTGEKKKLTLPKSNVLSFTLSDGANAILRPSGTEPKIKLYIAARGADLAEATAQAGQIAEEMTRVINC